MYNVTSQSAYLQKNQPTTYLTDRGNCVFHVDFFHPIKGLVFH